MHSIYLGPKSSAYTHVLVSGSINEAEECHKLLFKGIFFIFIAYEAKLIGGIYSLKYFRLPIARKGLEILINLDLKIEALKMKPLER